MAKQIPLRQCIGCREMKPKTELARVIRTPDNTVCLDKTGKANGRGAYICLRPECLDKAVKSRALERSLKTEIPAAIYDSIREELTSGRR